jgi:poly-gamma-glutamate capsule biosynthesis protein CapA/YwtB (metallophosphatase superfamily)
MKYRWLFSGLLVLAVTDLLLAQDAGYGPADPLPKGAAGFDPKRPIAQEMQTHVPDGFTVAAVGDMIISRPLFQYGKRMPEFKAVLDIFEQSDVVYGNLETTILDMRNFKGYPYSNGGDWTVASSPEVALDLKFMGFDLLSRANNHTLDWGLEGMRETSRWLDDAGIVHAGAGETHGLARAPQYFESAGGRVALVSLASTFLPGSEALPSRNATPGRPGLSALHLSETIEVPDETLKQLAQVQCLIYGQNCAGEEVESIREGQLFGTRFRLAEESMLGYTTRYAMNPNELAEIYQSIRLAQQHADFVIVAIHSHDCSLGCDDVNSPRGAGDFLKQLAREAIDSGADLFAVTGNHNLGAIEIYNSPLRGYRPIFYGLANFFWSDIQEYLPQELFDANREMLEASWQHPGRATEADLSTPLNAGYFANAFTFQSVVASVEFKNQQLDHIVLHPLELGYGDPLTESGIPRVVTSASVATEVLDQVVHQTEQFGLPKLNLSRSGSTAVIRP